jgi:transcriptional regulator with XRE-family HTH domain
MLFAEKIKQLREEKQMPQRKFLCKVSANRTCSSLPNRSQKSCKQFAAALEIDTPMYSKIELENRRAKREHIIVIARLLQTDKDILVTLWIADKIIAAIGEEKAFVGEALKIAKEKGNQK